ncbi:carbonic anhydrase [Alicyclobacillaceae bacterium I2511]|nr:carbonic anhydrase [Alicyclobacillaceae bacterium I2511]
MNQLALLYDILTYNESFVEKKSYEPYETSKFPKKGMVILSCMDTRLLELLPRAMNLRNGDAKIIKNAGAVLSHPFGSVMRSILVAVYELSANEVYVVGHHDCGMSTVNPEHMVEKMLQRGVHPDVFSTLAGAGIDLKLWLEGFETVETSVAQSVGIIKSHPLLPHEIPVHGLVIHPTTGKIDVVIDGYTHSQNN